MASKGLKCVYCGRTDFTSKRGLSQHQSQNQSCKFKIKAKFGIVSAQHTAHNFLKCAPVFTTNSRHIPDNVAQYFDQLITEDTLARKQLGTKNTEPIQKRARVDQIAQNSNNLTSNDIDATMLLTVRRKLVFFHLTRAMKRNF